MVIYFGQNFKNYMEDLQFTPSDRVKSKKTEYLINWRRGSLKERWPDVGTGSKDGNKDGRVTFASDSNI